MPAAPSDSTSARSFSIAAGGLSPRTSRGARQREDGATFLRGALRFLAMAQSGAGALSTPLLLVEARERTRVVDRVLAPVADRVEDHDVAEHRDRVHRDDPQAEEHHFLEPVLVGDLGVPVPDLTVGVVRTEAARSAEDRGERDGEESCL